MENEASKLVASELGKETICNHLRIDPEYLDGAEWVYVQGLQRTAISYICDHCAITAAEVDKHEDLAVATLVLISDMYDERGRYVDSVHVNRTVETILSHHDRNFIGDLSEAVDDAGR